MKTKVGNLHDGRKPTNGVYIGRGSIWGNPFKMTREDDRGEVIKKYAKWLGSQPNIVTKIKELRGKELRSFLCAKTMPRTCAIDVGPRDVFRRRHQICLPKTIESRQKQSRLILQKATLPYTHPLHAQPTRAAPSGSATARRLNSACLPSPNDFVPKPWAARKPC